MASVEFRNEQDGATISIEATGSPSVIEDVKAWADRNDFQHVIFWQDGDKLWVQLDEHRLNYWMPQRILTDGRTADIEMQLDYARGAQRRGAAGYEKFDR